MQQHFYLETTHTQIALAVSINGVHVFIDRNHAMPDNRLSINQWLFNGENEIDINFSVNPRFEHPLREQRANIKLVQYAGTKPDFVPSTIKEISWKYLPDETHFPVNIHDMFSAFVPYGPWSWQNARSLTADTIPWESLRMMLTEIHAALSTKSYAILEPYLRTKARELAQAYYIPVEERMNDQAAFFNELFAEPGWGMHAIDFDGIVPVFHAGGRIIELVDRKGNSPLKSTDLDGDTFTLSVRVALVDGNWILCR